MQFIFIVCVKPVQKISAYENLSFPKTQKTKHFLKTQRSKFKTKNLTKILGNGGNFAFIGILTAYS